MTNPNMTNPLKKFLILASTALTATAITLVATAAPTLRQNVTVNADIVTVGDMFTEAGDLAGTALFRAPAPGTAGQVDLAAIRLATTRIGLIQFDNPGFVQVRVARAGTLVTEQILGQLISDELRRQGTLLSNMNIQMNLNTALPNLYADNSESPVLLEQFGYVQGNERFSARFSVAGRAEPINVTGRLIFSIQAPHLVRSLPSGSVLQSSDIEMRPISLRLANSAGVTTMDQLVGKQLQRQLREGILLRTNDVAEPILIARNDEVTLLLRSGPMTLTVKGQALSDASQGETITVLNLLSNRVIRGIAIYPGTVEVTPVNLTIAAL